MSAEKVMHTVREAVPHLKQRYAQRAIGKSSGKIQGLAGEKNPQWVWRNAPIHCETAESWARPASKLAWRASRLTRTLPQRALQVAQLRFVESDTGADHPLIRTIRVVGYQIGGNHLAG